MKIRLLSIALLGLFFIYPSAQTFGSEFQLSNVTILGPWARSSFSLAKSTAAYMSIKNKSSQIEQLIAIESPIAKRVELHQAISKDGVMKMSKLDILDIPAKSIIKLKPGGRHVMFFGLINPLEEGSQFPLTLEFSRAGKVKIMVKVLKSRILNNEKRNHHKH
jgi:copper(I)-binding protein